MWMYNGMYTCVVLRTVVSSCRLRTVVVPHSAWLRIVRYKISTNQKLDGRLPKVWKELSARLSPIVDQSRDLRLERLGWTRWASANLRAEAAQDQVAPRLLDPPSAEAVHSLFVLAALDTFEMVGKAHGTGKTG